MQMQRRTRSALTMLETGIALTLFAAMMYMVINFQLGYRAFSIMEGQKNDLESMCRTLSATLIADLGNAAIYNVNANWVFPRVTRTPDPMALTPPAVPSASAERTRKDALEFLHIRTSAYTTPSPQTDSYAYFSIQQQSNTAWTNLSGYAAASYSSFLVVDPTSADGSTMVRPVWEASITGLTASQNANPLCLRHLLYQVVNVDATTGCGDLIRCYWNGAAAGTVAAPAYTSWQTWTPSNAQAVPPIGKWIQDGQPLARNVQRFSAQTYKWQNDYYTADSLQQWPKPTLAQNQIFIEVTVLRNIKSEQYQITANEPAFSRTVRLTVAMRSITD